MSSTWLSKTLQWAYQFLTGAQRENPETAAEEQKAEIESWTTVAECETACVQKLERLYDLFRSLPDEWLSETKRLSFNGGRDHTYTELLDYPRWNVTNHLGRIAYVQTLCGDRQNY